MPQPLRLIIVDDESFMRDNLAHLFPWEELGYEVASVFANGREALAYLEHNPADVVLTDIQMPVMDGLEATRIIRKMERPDAVQIPIFAMTANAFSDDRKRCKEAGMTEHLAKPLNSEKMIAKLRLYYNRKV